MPIIRTACVVAAAVLAGCTAPPPAVLLAAGPQGPAIPFRCPKPGTAVFYGRSSQPVTFADADPADPLVCLGALPGRSQVRRIANYMVAPSSQERAIRDGMAPLFPIVPGKTAEFRYLGTYSNERTLTGEFIERWTTDGSETVQVDGKPVQAVLFTREVSNLQRYGSAATRWRLWYDPGTGVWVRGEPTMLRGETFNARPFQAARVTVP